jgi:hypothetical protein
MKELDALFDKYRPYILDTKEVWYCHQEEISSREIKDKLTKYIEQQVLIGRKEEAQMFKDVTYRAEILEFAESRLAELDRQLGEEK